MKFRTAKNELLDSGSKSYIKQEGMRSQLEWIKRQLEYASFSEKFCLRYNLKKGEIYEFDWGINVNAEFSNRHFGVVLKDSDEFNPLVVVCPLKSNHGEVHRKSDVDLGIIKELNTFNRTIAVVNQVRTIDKLRIYLKRVIGVSDINKINELNEVTENTIMRLENYKFNMVMNAYKRFLFGEN